MEFDNKHFNHLILTSSQETSQFYSISSDGQILFWDCRLIDKDSKKSQQDILTISWKAMNGIYLKRPQGAGMMGGGEIQKKIFLNFIQLDQNISTFSGITIYKIKCCFRCKSPFFENFILTLYDFNFCVWKHNVTFPIFESLIMIGAHIICGELSPYLVCHYCRKD